MKNFRLGIDVGSTTVKLALIDSEQNVVFSRYERHHANIQEALLALFTEGQAKFPGAEFSAMITGSGGLTISNWLEVPFIQEVVAVTKSIESTAKGADVAIEIGGEDAKIIYFTGGVEQRMNGICAGGTGSFIDQMATLLQTDAPGLNELAKNHKMIYPIAARCGVFAKSDIQPLINEGAAKEDLAASVFGAVVSQTISGLAQGKPIRGNVAFLGGPLHFLSELRERFIQTLNLSEENVIVPSHSHLFAAIGGALSSGGATFTFETLIHNLKTNKIITHEIARLDPLFKNAQALEEFKARHAKAVVKKGELSSYSGKVYLGIDAGSTTTKLAVIGEEGELLHSYYGSNKGNPLKVVIKALKEIYGILPSSAKIAGSCVTGYGEALIKAALGVDIGKIETVSHYKAAAFFEPEVDFVLDIGGQDMKCIRIKDGVIDNVLLNEACSAGCGSFIETFATSLNVEVPQFAEIALFAKEPIDLGSRCTVFMNSRVKQAQKEGAEVADISAGLSYAVIKNALQKVIKVTDPQELGRKIVVQGGTFCNSAVLRAFETVVEREVLRPDIAGLMGAFGAAIIAKEEQGSGESTILSAKELDELKVTTSTTRCRLCENNCTLTINKFSGKKRFVSGNRCERPLGNDGQEKTKKGFDMFLYKAERMFGYQSLSEEAATRGTVGLVRALNMYENYPFWHTFFTKLGYRVVLSPQSSRKIYEKGIESMPSESVCYPAKLVHGHIMALIEDGVRFIFYPSVTHETREYAEASDCYNCPIVTSYPENIRANVEEIHTMNIDYRNPFLNLGHPESLLKQLVAEFPNIPESELKTALDAAGEEMERARADIRKKGEEIAKKAEKSGEYAIVLAGRPYHIDPEIHHGISQLITDYGISVITEDGIAHLSNAHHEAGPLNVRDQWMYHSRLYAAAAYVAKSRNLELVQLNSFGCGLDAVTTDEVQDILESTGKIYTCLKIDEVNNLGSARIRIRSLFAALEERERRGKKLKPPKPRPTRVVFTEEMKAKHTILAPQMAPIHFGLVEEVFSAAGYNFVMMPAIDKEAVDIGLRYVNNDACYPAIIVVGQLLKALKSGEYDTNNVSLVMTQTGGGCRASNYIAFIRRALRKAGYPDIPVISASTGGYEKNPGWKYTLPAIKGAVKALIYGDLLMRVLYAVRPYEAKEGSTNALFDEWYERVKIDIRENKCRNFKKYCKKIVADFEALPVLDIQKPKVGVVGEILVKYHPTANNDIVTLLEGEGAEAVVPDLVDFFSFQFYNHIYKSNHLGGSKRSRRIFSLVIKILERYRRHAKKALQNSRFEAPKKIKELADLAEEILSLGNQTGEGWLLTAEMVELIHSGVNNIVCTQPFACLPNHVTGKGMIKEIKRHYPLSNIVPIDYDPGASEVNQLNRIILMLSAARKNMEVKEVKETAKAR